MRNKKRLTKFTIVVIVFALLAYVSYRYFNSADYFLSKMPEKYKHYPTLSDKILAAHHQVVKLFSGAKVKDVQVDSLHHILTVSKMAEIPRPGANSELLIVYYRLGGNGHLLDSLQESSNGIMGVNFDGHLLYEEYYTNYLLSGGLGQHHYLDYNRKLDMKSAKLKKLVDSLQALADAVKSDYKLDDTVSKDVIWLSVHQNIYRVFTKSASQVTADSKYNPAFRAVWPITSYQANSRYNWTDKRSPIQIDYFLKQEHNKAWSTGFMAPAPMSAPANWGGIGYFSIHYTNDTLFFQHPTYYYDDLDFTDKKPYYDNNMWGKLDLFTIPGFSFQLITVGYGTEDIHPLDGCYLVLHR